MSFVINRAPSTGFTLTSGARQLVVHDALDTMSSFEGSYFSSFTPITNIGASADGAVMTTFLAPPFRCPAACSCSTVDGISARCLDSFTWGMGRPVLL
jgi:hypothetical protein